MASTPRENAARARRFRTDIASDDAVANGQARGGTPDGHRDPPRVAAGPRPDRRVARDRHRMLLRHRRRAARRDPVPDGIGFLQRLGAIPDVSPDRSLTRPTELP